MFSIDLIISFLRHSVTIIIYTFNNISLPANRKKIKLYINNMILIFLSSILVILSNQFNMRRLFVLTTLIVTALACLSLKEPVSLTKPPCRYYAYILYGEASLTSDIKRKEKVYFESN